MKAAAYTLEFLTPCFCAGADQGKAEIRAPSIRGQLRWWFRTLGGTADDERHVFGGVAGTASASSLVIRVKSVRPGPVWQPPANLDMNSDSYVYHFASVSGTTQKGGKGPRWTAAGALSPGTTFQVEVLQRCPIAKDLQARFELARRCFLQLGSLGLRATRGLGAFACHEELYTPAILEILRARDFTCEFRSAPLANAAAIAREIGGLVKGTRKATGMKFDRPSPFGSSTPRQTSAIYFRPVRPNPVSKDCALVVLEAPHARVLGKESDLPRVLGHTPSRLAKPERVGRRY